MTSVTLEKARPVSEAGKTAVMVGLPGITDYPDMIFMDRVKQSRGWQDSGNVDWPVANLDANGNMASLPSGVTSARQYIFASAISTATDLAAFGANLAGQWMVWWTGGPASWGTDATFGGYTPTGVTSSGQSVTFTLASDIGGYNLSISFANLNTNGVVTSIHCVRTADLTAYNAGEKFAPGFLALMDSTKVHTARFLEWMGTNNSNQINWSDRPLLTSKTWAGYCPIEVIVELCNRTGVNPWLNIPDQSTPAYWASLATYLRDNLSSSLIARIEYSNETWNFSYGHASRVLAAANTFFGTTGGDKYVQYYGVKMAKIGKAFDAVYGANRRYLMVMCWQAANAGTASPLLTAPEWKTPSVVGSPADLDKSNYIIPGTVVDELAVAPYFGNNIASDAGIWPALQVSQANAVTYIASLCPAALTVSQGWVTSWKNVADGYGLPLQSYENGMHLELNTSHNQNLWGTIFTVPNGTAYTVGELVSQPVTVSSTMRAVSGSTITIDANPFFIAGSTITQTVGGQIAVIVSVAGNVLTMDRSMAAFVVGNVVTCPSTANATVLFKTATTLELDTKATVVSPPFNATNLLTSPAVPGGQTPTALDNSHAKATPSVSDLFEVASYSSTLSTYYAQHMTNSHAAGVRFFNILSYFSPFSIYGAWGLYRWFGDANARVTAVLAWITANPRDWTQKALRKIVVWP